MWDHLNLMFRSYHPMMKGIALRVQYWNKSRIDKGRKMESVAHYRFFGVCGLKFGLFARGRFAGGMRSADGLLRRGSLHVYKYILNIEHGENNSVRMSLSSFLHGKSEKLVHTITTLCKFISLCICKFIYIEIQHKP